MRWTSHGLPVEYEIDKKLGITTKEQVEEMGIAAYNKECRDIVMRYSTDWQRIVTRMGRWIDFENDYKTLNLSFMESVWWVFSQLHEKGLVYRGFKVTTSSSCYFFVCFGKYGIQQTPQCAFRLCHIRLLCTRRSPTLKPRRRTKTSTIQLLLSLFQSKAMSVSLCFVCRGLRVWFPHLLFFV